MTQLKPSVIAVFSDGMAAEVLIPGMTVSNLPLNPDISADVTAGSQYASRANVKSTKPEVTFSSKSIDVLLDLFGTAGLAINSGGGGEYGMRIYQLQTVSGGCGIVDPGNVHRIIQIENACGYLNQITASAGEDAAGTGRIIVKSSDGISLPITVLENQAPPAAVQENLFALGPVQLGNATNQITADEITQLTIDLGITAEGILTDSAVAPKEVDLQEQVPKVTLTTNNAALFGGTAASQIGAGGIELNHANSFLRLRKRGTGTDAYVADATAEHISFTMEGLFNWEDPANAQGNSIINSSGMATCIQNAAGDVPLIAATGVAI